MNYPKLRLRRRVGLFNLLLGRFGFCNPRLFKSWDYLNPTNPDQSVKFLRIGDFEKLSFFESAIFQKKTIICFIPMKISPNLYGKMDVSKFWCFHWFPENSLLCVILCYTVYVWIAISSPTFSRIFCILLPLEFAINFLLFLSLIHIWRCRRSYACRSRWSPYH